MMKQLLQLVMNVCSLVKLVLLKHNVALVELDISQEQIVNNAHMELMLIHHQEYVLIVQSNVLIAIQLIIVQLAKLDISFINLNV